jgi:hypothetical protein
MPTVPGQLTVGQDTFGGLRLDVDPLELGFQGAVDMLDVDIGQDGGLLARPGFQLWHANATNLGTAVSWLWSDYPNVVFAYGNDAKALNADTAAVIASGALTASASSAVIFRVAGVDKLLVATDNSHPVYKVSAGAWATTGNTFVATSKVDLLDFTPWDNRLVSIGEGGGQNIYFSAADDDTTMDADDFINPPIEPFVSGGRKYTASARWRDLLFVFGPRSFIVLTGTSTDSIGGAIFDYRVVDYGVGAAAVGGACAAPEGVYVLSDRGLYLTTGGAPQLVSDAVRPLFLGGSATEFTAFSAVAGHRVDPSGKTSMTYRQGKLFLSVRSTTSSALNRRTLVFDTTQRTWAVWSIGGVGVAAADPFRESLLDEASNSAAKSGVWVAGPTSQGVTDDDSVWRMVPLPGSAGTGPWDFARGQDYSVAGGALADITGRYRTGYNDFNAPGEKTLRRMLLDGTGTVTRKVFDERNTALTYATESVVLGATRTEGWARTSAKGRAFSVQYEGTGNFSLNRVDHVVQRLRQPLVDARV